MPDTCSPFLSSASFPHAPYSLFPTAGGHSGLSQCVMCVLPLVRAPQARISKPVSLQDPQGPGALPPLPSQSSRAPPASVPFPEHAGTFLPQGLCACAAGAAWNAPCPLQRSAHVPPLRRPSSTPTPAPAHIRWSPSCPHFSRSVCPHTADPTRSFACLSSSTEREILQARIFVCRVRR